MLKKTLSTSSTLIEILPMSNRSHFKDRAAKTLQYYRGISKEQEKQLSKTTVIWQLDF